MASMTYALDQIHEVAKQLCTAISTKIVCLEGEMGSGKTTLVKALISELGAKDSGSSPTFSLVNEYVSDSNETIAYHFDCYRLNSEEEALDIGIEEYISSGKWVFIEWPEYISGLLPRNYTTIHIKLIDEERREIRYLS